MGYALLKEKPPLGPKVAPRPKTAMERAGERWFSREKSHLKLGCASVEVVHPDHLGTPQKITNQAQATVWEATYTPFGKATITTSTITNNLRFPGQYYDQETNLHYNLNRYYDPQLGRYITSDRIGLAGGMNSYGYALQNPIRYVDPDGRIPIPVFTGAAGAIGAFIGTASTGGSPREIIRAAVIGGLAGAGAGLGLAFVPGAVAGTITTPGITQAITGILGGVLGNTLNGLDLVSQVMGAEPDECQ